MTSRSVPASLCLALCLSLAAAGSGSARADMVVEEPPRLEVRAEPATYGDAPTSVALVVTNPSREPVELRGPRLVVVTGGVRVPLRILRFEVDGRARRLWDPLTVPPGASIRVSLAFDALPAAALARGRLELALRFEGAREASFTLRRG